MCPLLPLPTAQQAPSPRSHTPAHTLQSPQPSSRVPHSPQLLQAPQPSSRVPHSPQLLQAPHCRWGQTQTPSCGRWNSPLDVPTATATPSRPADPQLALTEDLASAALSAWKVPPPDHIAGFVTCFIQRKAGLLRDALSDASPKAATCLAVCKVICFDFFRAVTAFFHDPLHLHGLLSPSPAPHTKMCVPRQQETRLSSPPL